MTLEGGEGAASRSRSLFTPGKDPATVVQEAGLAPGSVWMGAENVAPTGIRSPTVHLAVRGLEYLGERLVFPYVKCSYLVHSVWCIHYILNGSIWSKETKNLCRIK